MTLNMPYKEVIEKIISETNLSKEEVEKRINEKVQELGGLITLEGAAHIIAKELEINLYNSKQIQKPQSIKVKDLIDGMNNVSITVLIKQTYEPKIFTRNDGTQAAVQNILLTDKTGICRLILWDDQIRQFNDIGLKRGDIIKILNAFVKENKFDSIKELSLSSRSLIESDSKAMNKKEFPDSLLSFQKITNLKIGLVDLDLYGKITAIKKLSKFSKKDGSEGVVSSLEIADETGKTRVILWDTKAELINNFKIGDVVEIIGGYTRQGLNNIVEIHLGKNGNITKNTKLKITIPKEILESKSVLLNVSGDSSHGSMETRLADLNDKMTNISIIARITGISKIREFNRKDGTNSQVGSVLVMDNSGSSKITFWNNMTEHMKKVQIGDVIRIEGAYVKAGLRGEYEVQVGNNAILEINPEYIKDAIPELTISYTNLSSVKPNMKDVNLKAVVTQMQELRTFNREDGSEGNVLNMTISDNSGSLRLVAWDEKAIELEEIEEMSTIEVLHGYSKEGNQGIEIHLGALSTIKKLNRKESAELNKIKQNIRSSDSSSLNTPRVDLVDLEEGQFSEIKGTILKIYESKMHYSSCPKCKKKITEQDDKSWLCSEHGIVEPQKNIFISLALDDGTGCVRVTFFRELAEQLIEVPSNNLIDELENSGIQSTILKLEQRLKGREIIVRGKSKKNAFDDSIDVIASSFSDINPKNEIKLLKSSLNV